MLPFLVKMGRIASVVPLWKRILAYIFDVLLLSVLIFSPLTHPFDFDIQSKEHFFQSFASYTSSFSTQYLLLAFFLAFLTLLYFCILEFWLGQTVGKMLLGIRVEGLKKKELSLIQTLLRNIPKLSSILLFFDTLYLLFSKGGQRYFETLSDTHVVYEVKNCA